MPRTVYQPDPSWKGNPSWDNPSFLRGCAEEAHHEPLHHASHLPMPIFPIGALHDRKGYLLPRDDGLSHGEVERELPYNVRIANSQDIRAFCWKDCVIYVNERLTGSDDWKLFDDIYREWFPHRAEDKDVSDGSFFCHIMRFTPPTNGIDQIIRFHQKLCTHFQGLEKEGIWQEEKQFAKIGSIWNPRTGPHQLRETFPLVFIVVHSGWQENGVLIVWKNEDTATRYGCQESEEIILEGKAEDLGDASIYRCPLQRAMRLVVSQDPHRAQKRREYSMVLEETLGDPEDGCQ